MKTVFTSLVFVLVILYYPPRVCEGDACYTWINQGMYTAGSSVTYELDFNNDAIIDLLFESTGMWFSVDPLNENRAIAGGDAVHALSEGYLVGPSVDTNDWQQGNFGLILNSCAVLPPPYGVTCNGEFVGTTAYMGVKFYIDDNEHYGWVRISNPWVGISGGIIMDFAYETEPGIGILAGAGVVPEPTTIGLLSVGILLFAIRYRRLKQ